MAVEFDLKAPWEAQLEFFRQKLALPTEAWDDIRGEANDRAFFVAGAQAADLLADFAAAVENTIAEGKSIGWFLKNFDKIVQKHGWDYKGERNWRSRVIYQTNLLTSHQAGRWAQLTDPDLLAVKPLWTYRHGHPIVPRELHLSWDKLTLPAQHPWFSVHWPPNGFGCTCYVVATSEEEAKRKGYQVMAEPPDDGTYDYVNPKTGEITELPKGVDYGWDYAPGANTRTALREFVQRKLVDYPEAITKMLSREANRYINAKERPSEFAAAALADGDKTKPLWLGFVESFAEIAVQTGVDAKGYLVLLPGDAPRHIELSHGNDGKGQRPAVPEDYNQLLKILNDFDEIELSPKPSRHGNPMLVTFKAIGGETYRCIWEVLPGKKSRALALVSMVIKT